MTSSTNIYFIADVSVCLFVCLFLLRTTKYSVNNAQHLLQAGSFFEIKTSPTFFIIESHNGRSVTYKLHMFNIPAAMSSVLEVNIKIRLPYFHGETADYNAPVDVIVVNVIARYRRAMRDRCTKIQLSQHIFHILSNWKQRRGRGRGRGRGRERGRKRRRKRRRSYKHKTSVGTLNLEAKDYRNLTKYLLKLVLKILSTAGWNQKRERL